VSAAAARPAAPVRAPATPALPAWWPLAALTLAAAALRLSTLGLQSFWYDEAFTVMRVLHPGLGATLRSFVHTENTPPLWYLIAWADARVLGTGEVALRLPSALFGIAAVPVAWGIGRELSGRRVAVLCAAIVAVNPLFWWYSQEARAYELFVLASALAMLCFLRARRDPTPRRMALFALTGALSLLSHYFAVFLLAPMALILLADPRTRRRALAPAAGLVAVGLALLPLVIAQGGHGTQWIGRWPLRERLEAIPQYYLTGYTGSSLGHGVELLIALPILAGLGFGVWRAYEPPAAARARGEAAVAAQAALPRERAGLWVCVIVAAAGILFPLVLALAGEDFLAPRNLVGAMVPVSAAIALLVASPSTGRLGAMLGAAIVAAMLAITIDVNLSPRLQRGDWRGVAHALGRGTAERAITTVELGETPLQYYVRGIRNMPRGSSALLTEIDETGYAPLRARAAEAPAAGFHLQSRLNIRGLIVYRFVSPVPRLVSEASLRRHVITLATPEVLVPADALLST
jgi:4-amino-4-deoxy-L-arabinose transferase-like glycosyltransferase